MSRPTRRAANPDPKSDLKTTAVPDRQSAEKVGGSFAAATLRDAQGKSELSQACSQVDRAEDVTYSLAQRYPLLTALLAIKGVPLQATYTLTDVAHLLNVSIRAIQDRVASGKLSIRDLPGRAKFLPDDLEEFLSNSRKTGAKKRM